MFVVEPPARCSFVVAVVVLEYCSSAVVAALGHYRFVVAGQGSCSLVVVVVPEHCS